MKKLLACAAALGLFLSVPTLAQNNDHRDNQHNAPADRGSSDSHRNDQGRATRGQNGQARTMTGNTHKRVLDGNTGAHQARPGANTSADRMPNGFLPASGDVHPSPPNRATADKARNESGWSGNTVRHQSNLNTLRRNMHATRQFHGGSYSGPQGYQSRHWSYGERLPQGYFVRNYWIANVTLYDLFAPPPELVWVRVGADALLIDRETGDIVQVRYGVFY